MRNHTKLNKIEHLYCVGILHNLVNIDLAVEAESIGVQFQKISIFLHGVKENNYIFNFAIFTSCAS